MKRKRHTPDEIIRKLREAETQLAGTRDFDLIASVAPFDYTPPWPTP